jgi:hypothetical protein
VATFRLLPNRMTRSRDMTAPCLGSVSQFRQDATSALFDRSDGTTIVGECTYVMAWKTSPVCRSELDPSGSIDHRNDGAVAQLGFQRSDSAVREPEHEGGASGMNIEHKQKLSTSRLVKDR